MKTAHDEKTDYEREAAERAARRAAREVPEPDWDRESSDRVTAGLVWLNRKEADIINKRRYRIARSKARK